MAWFADSAIGAATYSILGPGEVFASLDMNIRFLRPVMINSGVITVDAQIRHSGRRLKVVSAELKDAQGKTAAIATSSVLVVPGGIEALIKGWDPEQVLGVATN